MRLLNQATLGVALGVSALALSTASTCRGDMNTPEDRIIIRPDE
jgi:hypothetical protein